MKEMERTLLAAEHAHVQLTDAEARRIAMQMQNLLLDTEQIGEGDCFFERSAIEMTALREDAHGESLSATVLLSAAGERTERYFSVPRAVEGCHEE